MNLKYSQYSIKIDYQLTSNNKDLSIFTKKIIMTIQESIDKLKAGNARFVEDMLDGKLQDSSRRDSLVGGQTPYAIILSCADSRVVPEFTFDAGLGELFVVRVAGNVANTSSIASIEYAVANLGSNLIVVLGHQSCGAVHAAIAGGDNGHNLNHLLAQISPAISSTGDGAGVNDVVRKNAQLNAIELKSRSSIISEAIDNGSVKVVPAFYNLDTGKVDFL
jgi:carbonic anhydrase